MAFPAPSAGLIPAQNLVDQIYAPVASDLKRVDALFEEVLATDNEFVLDMVKHLGQNLGKRVRSALTLLSFRACRAGNVEEHAELYRQSLIVAEAVELIHNATLVHDDVIDDSPTRRGFKTLNYTWGNEITVLMGDFIFARVFGLLARHVEPRIIQVISVATDRLCEGEIQEVRSRYMVTQSEAEYFDTIEKKTAALMAVACEAAGILAGASEERVGSLRTFGLKIGIAFQLADDILDLTAPAEKLGKPNGHDLTEGKLTLPVLRALAIAPREERARISELLLNSHLSEAQLAEIVAFIHLHGGVEYARARAQALVAEAKAELTALPESTFRQSLEGLADYILRREY